MAPGLTETTVDAPAVFTYDNPSRLVFPDGIKTSGQFPPDYDKIQLHEKFPNEITGATVWQAKDYANNPEQWVHHFSEEEVQEMSETADAFMASSTPLTGISKENYKLPTMAPFLSAIRAEILNGKGFILFKGLPVTTWGLHKSAVAYMGLGTHLGYFVSQNRYGHVLGHVKDVGGNAADDEVRVYRTTARQFFHADDCDIVGLLCVACALEGGESDIVSVHHVFNTLQRERPDVVRTLCESDWFWDRKGEISVGQEPYMRQPIFYKETGEDGRVFAKWDPMYVKSLRRFWDAGAIPSLSPAQQEALRVLEETCAINALHMILDVGDIQFLSNTHVLHARTAYKDYPPPAPRRHLMRLWLATPEHEGGWRLPFPDSGHKKRGGVQVDDTAPKAPLDAE